VLDAATGIEQRVFRRIDDAETEARTVAERLTELVPW
jgi:hypothetical protein